MSNTDFDNYVDKDTSYTIGDIEDVIERLQATSKNFFSCSMTTK